MVPLPTSLPGPSCPRTWAGMLLETRSRARLSSMLRITSQSSFTAAASLGKCPQLFVTFRSWWFNDEGVRSSVQVVFPRKDD